MTSRWISTADLCRHLSMSRQALDKLRRGNDPIFHPGIHFISKGSAVNAGLLWSTDAVVKTLADQAKILTHKEMPFLSINAAEDTSKFTAGLTPEQRDAFLQITSLIKSAKTRIQPGEPDVLCALLTGYAGTGKSFLVARLMQWCEAYFSNPRTAIDAIAPTHKAGGELLKKLKSAGNSFCEVTTLARYLGKKKGWDSDGSKVFRIAEDALTPTSPALRVCFCDELSMVSDNDLALLITKLGKRKVDENYPRSFPQIVLIGIGDPRQLEPVKAKNTMFRVGSDDSPWPADLWDVDAKLTEVVRHGGPILDLATKIREHGATGRPLIETNISSESSVEVLKPREWIDQWLERLEVQHHAPKDVSVQALAHKNRVVNRLNAIARDHLYGPDARPFQPAERILTMEPVIDPDDGTVICGTSTEVCVVSADLMRVSLEGITINGYWIEGFLPHVEADDGTKQEIEFLTLDPADRDAYKEAIEKAKKPAVAQEAKKKKADKWTDRDEKVRKELWKHYFTVAEYYCPTEPAYCMTVHKSQGSTYEEVFVDQLDLDSCSDKATQNRLTYVAATRASHKLIIRL